MTIKIFLELAPQEIQSLVQTSVAGHAAIISKIIDQANAQTANGSADADTADKGGEDAVLSDEPPG